MNKVGLCVCNDSHNYGSQLQLFATMKSLEELNIEYEIINYKKRLTPYFILSSLPRLLNYNFVQGKISYYIKMKKIKKDKDIYKKFLKKEALFSDFEKKYFLPKYREVYGYSELSRTSSYYYAFLVGSDQLWLPSNLGSNFYNLNFVKNKIRISYATSFGVSSIPWYQRKRTKSFLEKFDYLSVREESGKKIIESISNAKAKVLVDPTLAISKNDWQKYIPCKKVIKDKYILCYFLGYNPKYIEQIKRFADRKKMPVAFIPSIDSYNDNEDYYKGDFDLFELSTEDFVNLIRNAEYVLTDSFHGSVFSVINNKKFMVFDRFKKGRNSRNSRIDNLCKMFSLSDRRYRGDIFEIDKDINYEDVNKILECKIMENNNFLKKALNKSIK